MDAVLQELKRDEEKALRARVQKAASSSKRCRSSLRSLPSSQLRSSGPSVSPAAEAAASCQQQGRLTDQAHQDSAKNVPAMPAVGPRVDRDLLRIDSEVLSVRKAALLSLHEVLVLSAKKPFQVWFRSSKFVENGAQTFGGYSLTRSHKILRNTKKYAFTHLRAHTYAPPLLVTTH